MRQCRYYFLSNKALLLMLPLALDRLNEGLNDKIVKFI